MMRRKTSRKDVDKSNLGNTVNSDFIFINPREIAKSLCRLLT